MVNEREEKCDLYSCQFRKAGKGLQSGRTEAVSEGMGRI